MKTTRNIPILKPRREVLRASLRFGGLFVLGGIASALGWRSARNSCVRPNPCGACPLFTACDLPQALDSKKSTAKPNSNNHG